MGVEQPEGEEPKEAGEGGRSSPPHICIEPCSACNFYLVLTHSIALSFDPSLARLLVASK